MNSVFINKTSITRQYLLLLVIFLSLTLFEWVGWYEVVRGPLETAVSPVMAVQYRLVSGLTLPLRRLQLNYDRAERIKDLESKYSKALAQLVELEQLRQENQKLQTLLNTKRVAGGVLTVPILSVSHPSLQAGKRQGVEVGDMVLVDHTLIGVIAVVSDEQSQLTLLSNPKITPVLAKTESGVRGIVVGDGKNVLLKELPRDASLKPEEKVTTIGQAGIEPNILIGTIRTIEAKPESPVQIAVVEQLVSFYDSILVEVR